MLGEEASEARNKDYKRSSSVILKRRIKNQKRLPFPPNVLELFAILDTDATSNITSEDELQEDLSSFSELIPNLDEIELSGEE
ncbi:family transcriptional regulator [Lasius niger]|uniref:Family transcriptional regulator n=1 Tax=Lasius niger TaxID=67767 RepID=A0A0J7KAE2_LASNI|nr:family transcriptional regulator [Lasius niger]